MPSMVRHAPAQHRSMLQRHARGPSQALPPLRTYWTLPSKSSGECRGAEKRARPTDRRRHRHKGLPRRRGTGRRKGWCHSHSRRRKCVRRGGFEREDGHSARNSGEWFLLPDQAFGRAGRGFSPSRPTCVGSRQLIVRHVCGGIGASKPRINGRYRIQPLQCRVMYSHRTGRSPESFARRK